MTLNVKKTHTHTHAHAHASSPYLQEGRHDDHRAPQQLVVAHGGEEEPDLRHARARQVEHRRDHEPPKDAAGDLRGPVRRRFELLLVFSSKWGGLVVTFGVVVWRGGKNCEACATPFFFFSRPK